MAGTEPVRTFTTNDALEVMDAIVSGAMLLEVDAAVSRGRDPSRNVSVGYFWLWLDGAGMARVRLDEHREHFARDPARAGMSGEIDGFLDGDGGVYAVAAADAITAIQAQQALECWLETGEWWPELTWS